MTNPKVNPGDKVQVSYETQVNNEGWFFGRDFHGPSFPEVKQYKVEVLEPADNPANDPVGTVASLGATIWVKTASDWRCVTEQWPSVYEEDFNGCTIIGAVPGTPAAQAQEQRQPTEVME